jgi:UDP-2,4-diacetamido-2,4,6-trideoxy-beta-L-altropyranose hydrolase
MIAFRVDVNQEIATGHAMRCIAIASKVRDKGYEPVFIVSDATGDCFFRDHNFHTVILNSKWDEKESELLQLINTITQLKISAMLVDSYAVNEHYLQELFSITRIVYIDDFVGVPHHVNAIIHYNVGADLTKIRLIYQYTNTTILLGPKYAPLREEFSGLTSMEMHTTKSVLITTGGGDQYGFATKIVNYLLELPQFAKLSFHVLIGSFAKVDASLLLCPRIIVHQNAMKVAALMQSCDVAISAGGSTLYELAACGTPTISFILADNKLPNVLGFDRCGFIPYAGDIRVDQASCLGNISKHLLEYIENHYKKQKVSDQMRSCVDGLGSDRIADFLIQLSYKGQ